MKVHELKTWPAPFAAVYDGAKRHEIRKADRDYAVGDLLHLREWAPATHAYDLNGPRPGAYTGRELRALVTYLTRGGEWGIPDGMCVMSIEPIAVSLG